MRLRDLQQIFHETLDLIYGANEVDSFFFLLTEAFYNVPRIQLILEPDYAISKMEQELIFKALDDLKNEIPIQYIIGQTAFYGLEFKVNEHVLIPRPETEELVEWIISASEKTKPITILDIGTGSGCIAVSLAKQLPNAKVYAIDVSQDALKMAKYNAELNGVDVVFVTADILKIEGNVINAVSTFDIIVSNPPYVRNLEKLEIKPNVLNNEPHLALFVENDSPLQFYEAICKLSVNNLKPTGQLYFEINQYLGTEMKALMEAYGYDGIDLRKDLYGNDRMIKGTKNNNI